MRRSWFITFAVVVGCVVTVQTGVAPAAEVAAQTLRIMPLGDSITQGSPSAASYRRPLWHQLEQGQFDVDFIGSLDTGFNGNAATDFDLDHEGHWGWRADELVALARGWATAPAPPPAPDIVLLHIGTNDALQGQSASSTVAEIGQLIDAVRATNADVVVLLAQLIPANVDQTVTSRITSINSGLPGLATSKSTPQSPVTIVDHATGFNAITDTYDGLHPNTSGESKMAAKWYTALSPLISTLPPTTTTTSTTLPPTTTTVPAGSGGSVGFVGATVGDGVLSTRAEVVLPSVVAGDVIVVSVTMGQSVPLQPPVGYAVLRDLVGSASLGFRMVVLYRVADGSETAFTMQYPEWARMANNTVAAVYRGADLVSPIESSATALTAWVFSVDTPALTSVRSGARLVAMAQTMGSSGVHTWSSPMTRRGAVCCTVASVADRSVGAGATGQSALTFNGATAVGIVALVVRPATTTPPPTTTTTSTTLPPTTTTTSTTLPPTTTTTSTTLPPTTATTSTTLPPTTTTTSTTLPPTTATTSTTLPPTTTTTSTTLPPTTTTTSSTTTTSTTLPPTTTTVPPGSGGSVSFVGAAVGDGAVGTRAKVVLPPVVAGDVIVVSVAMGQSVPLQPPAGYAVLRDLVGSATLGFRMVVLYRVADGSETAFTMQYPGWARTANNTVAAVYRGADAANPIESSATALTAWVFSVDTPASTSVRSGARLVAMAQTMGSSGVHTWSSPMTRRGAVCCTVASVADRSVGAGPTGQSTLTFNGATAVGIVALVVRPAGP